MNKYDFIRFGESVQWFDNKTDRFRTMQVCQPFNSPVNEDTEISLIISDKDECEEVYVSHSVKASELIPCITPYHTGFWQALSEVQKNGTSEATLLAVLRSLNIDMATCILLMHRSGYYRLYPVICQLFPGTEDIFQVITWEGKDYPARKLTIYHGMPEEQEVLVSVAELSGKLINSETGCPVSEEAEELDGTIYYYLTEDEMGLPDSSVIALVESA
ncbi:hypothetical protein POZ03_01335 [Bacteroides uniformis]|uniref:hypothetical protein n=1 Tax=Bacteroides uniformis TaxID=820 RepID=UPI00233F614A|nr:hypothetical protein [Bacteroides uniformis]MDC1809099.1 hypothetical protein [Bacteroides uniformis]